MVKIALDAQQLFEKEKTGVAWNAKKIIDEMTEDSSNEYILNYFWRRDLVDEKTIVQHYKNKGCYIRKCGFIGTAIFKVFEKIYPISYSWIFRDKVDVTQFFNFVIPAGVNGKTVTIVHDMAYMACPETLNKKNKMWLDKNLVRSCQNATAIATVSKFSKKEIIEYLNISESKVKVIYSGVDHERYHPNYPEKEIREVKEKFKIYDDYYLYLGTLEPRKNIEEIVEAYGRLVYKEKDCPKLVLAGRKGWLFESIFDKVKQLDIEENVIFTGYIDDDEKVRLICGAIAFIFPSLYEGFGTPPLEAMACGVPVIVSNRASLPEVVGNGGIQVPIGEVKRLSKAMYDLVYDKTIRMNMKQRGLNQANKFSWQRTVSLLMGIYQEIVFDDGSEE